MAFRIFIFEVLVMVTTVLVYSVGMSCPVVLKCFESAEVLSAFFLDLTCSDCVPESSCKAGARRTPVEAGAGDLVIVHGNVGDFLLGCRRYVAHFSISAEYFRYFVCLQCVADLVCSTLDIRK